MKPSKIIAVYLEFGSSHRWQLSKHLVPLLCELAGNDSFEILIVDNSMVCTNSDSFTVIPGDNTNREFSGWDRGLDYLSARGVDHNTAICLCNDTFARNYGTEYLNWFNSAEVNQALESGMAVGYVDSNLVAVDIFGHRIDSWLRSNLLFTRWHILEKLRPLSLSPALVDSLFSKSGPQLFKDNDSLAGSTQQWLEHWLVADGSKPKTERWYLATNLNESNRGLLITKASSILAELNMSATLQKIGVDIYDIRVSKTRAFGAYYVLNKLRILAGLRRLKRLL